MIKLCMVFEDGNHNFTLIEGKAEAFIHIHMDRVSREYFELWCQIRQTTYAFIGRFS